MAELAPEEIGAEFVPVRSADVYTVAIDGEAVLLDEDENRLHLLNHSAALLWSCFDGHATVHDLAFELSEELDHGYDTLLADTLTIVRDLGREGLLAGVRKVDA
jgi:Coenzyme PQQ synthesis protein D (PqqD)